MPASIKKNSNIAPNDAVYMRKRGHLDHGVPWRGEETVENSFIVSVSNIHQQGKPKCVTKYNKYMSGVNLNDMLTSFYLYFSLREVSDNKSKSIHLCVSTGSINIYRFRVLFLYLEDVIFIRFSTL